MRLIPVIVLALISAPLAAEERSQPKSETEKLHELFDEEWKLRLAESPRLATAVGERESDNLMEDVSPEAHLRAASARRALLERLDAIDVAQLSPQDRVSAAMFRTQLHDVIEEARFRSWEIPFNTDSGFHTSLAFIPRNMTFDSAEAYENYLDRLDSFPGYFDQQIANMRAGLARGATQPREILDGIEGTITAHLVDNPEESVFYAPFESFPASVPPEMQNRLRRRAHETISERVVPSFEKFHRFWLNEYLTGARSTLGASDLPDGRAWYEYLVRHYTTLDKTPEQIHQIGLAEVARIRAEMNEIIEEVGFEGTYQEFLDFLRTDPQFYAETPEELLKEAAWICKKMDGALPALFGRLPRLPYTVEPVPDAIAPVYTAGRYVPASEGSTRPGTYWVNTYDLKSRPLYTLEALSLHEAVPGHHLQNALASELDGLPNFRRYTYLSAFGEGWGLYSEWLGLEAGFYEDPYSNFGRLTYEMWRACRLVVDTGVHALGWTRDEAVEFLASNTALSLHEVSTEIDRYISWPAQALSYKIGELEIKRLRREAERELGEKFDVREFHDAVLLNGAVPLPVLADQIEDYVRRVKSEE